MSFTTITSHSPAETEQVAHDLTATLRPGTVITLSGNLGAGKTLFTKGLAKALGITAEITSPTFTLMNIYPLPHPHGELTKLVHIDAYRLENEAEFMGLGAEDYVGSPDTVSVIEWAEKIPGLAEYPHVISVTIESGPGTGRKISIEKKEDPSS